MGATFRDRRGRRNLSAAYSSLQPGQNSVAVDFSTPDGAERCAGLPATADVVIENFEVGGLRKFGLGSESLSKHRSTPGLLLDHPLRPGPALRARAGYDFVIQGMSGLMSITGPAGSEPQKASITVSDIFAGLYWVIAIQAALRHVERTSEGRAVDMALFDAEVSALANRTLNFLVSGVSPGQLGNAVLDLAPYEVMPVLDHHIVLRRQ